MAVTRAESGSEPRGESVSIVPKLGGGGHALKEPTLDMECHRKIHISETSD